jgi:DNA segregation ATPase FtsK/SpoIIIE-like protein
MEEQTEITALLKEIEANQLSLHDDMVAVIDRLTKLEATVTELANTASEPATIDEHQLYNSARSLVVETGRASTSLLQRVLRIGYSRAASLIDSLETNGIIGPPNSSNPREVFLDREKLDEIEDEEEEKENSPVLTGDHDDLYEEAKALVLEAGKSSTSYIQRRLRIGYSRAAFIQDLLEKNGVVGPANGAEPRSVNSYGKKT